MMRNLLLVMTFLSAAFIACNSQPADNGNAKNETTPQVEPDAPRPTGPMAKIEFDEYEHDFGKINEGDTVEHTFTFTNTGTEELIIANARPGCGCTVPSYPKAPIPPGGKGEIVVAFKSKGKNGVQRKSVSIMANTEPSTTNIYISSEVMPNADKPADNK